MYSGGKMRDFIMLNLVACIVTTEFWMVK